MTESPQEIVTRPPRRWLAFGLNSAGAFLLMVCFFSPARQIADVQLDSSNYSSYAYFTAHNFQFGPEVIPMAGPYGFVPYGFVYSGHLFMKRFGLELLTKLVLGVLVGWFMRRAEKTPWLRWVWLAVLLVMAPFIDDLPYALAILLTGLCLIECHAAKDRRSLTIACSLATYLALLTLFKGTQTTLAIATFGLLFLQALFLRDFRRLPWIVGAYLGALAGFLLLAGQNPLHLVSYLRGVLELSSGYNSAMGLDESPVTFLTGAAAAIGLELVLAVLLLRQWRNPTACAGYLLLAGFTFIEWKHGFVRADGHTYIFYNYACMAAPTILLFAGAFDPAGTPRWSRWLTHSLAWAALSIAFLGGEQPVSRHYRSIHMLPDRITASLHQLTHPLEEKARLEQLLGTRRSLYQLPRIKEIVDRSSIDFFGTQLGYLLLNQFNYRPRPMGGGPFNVVTPWLQDRNTAYVTNPATRPDFFLVEPLTIDNHFLTQDDPGTLLALLTFYTPIASELGVVLYQAKPTPALPPSPRLLRTEALVLGQSITPPEVKPNEMLLVSFSLPLTPRGRLRAALYKPPEIFMDVVGRGIVNDIDLRIIPNFFINPVPLNPVMEDNTDLLALYQGIEGKIVRHFTIHTAHPELLRADALKISFFATPRPTAEPELATRLIDSLGRPIFLTAPLLIESSNSPLRQFGALPVQILEPLGRIRFTLTSEEREISFIYGIDPKAYIEGSTDGVEFSVDIERPDHAPQSIFHRFLDPLNHPGDRGSHTERVPLPPFPRGTTISLRTGRGPAGNGAWDWAYFGGIRFHVRDYLPAQFPGFTRLPANVDAAMAGAISYQGHGLFMLNSPGALIFPLLRTDSRLVFSAGLLPGAYTAPGQSDGVEFTVNLRTPAGVLTPIFQKRINPRDVAADRGEQNFTVELPAYIRPDTQLILSALPGPAGNTSWDWSYISSLHFE